MSWLRRLYFGLLYFRQPPWDTQKSPPELMEFIAQHPPGRALDLGCGTGTNVITLAQHGWQVTGVDFVGRAIIPLNLQRKMLREADIIVAQGVKALRIVQMKEMHLAAPDYESELLRRYDNVIARLDSVRVDKDGEYYDIFTGEQIEED